MNRRSFLGLFGLGAVAGVLAKVAGGSKPQGDWWCARPPTAYKPITAADIRRTFGVMRQYSWSWERLKEEQLRWGGGSHIQRRLLGELI